MESFQNIGLKQISKHVLPQDGVLLGDDFFIIEVKDTDRFSFLKYPCRSDAYFAIFCKEGTIDVEINLREYHVSRNTLMISTPGNILRVEEFGPGLLSQKDFLVLAISKEFLSGIRIDFKKVFDERLTLLADPCVSLDDDEIAFCSKYVDLFKDVLSSGVPNKEEAVGSLIASLFYVLGGLLEKNFVRFQGNGVPATSEMRLKMLFERFMSLVSEYHGSERGMAFYAGRLGMTPKYLSKVIKQVSGRSAPDWIDSYVILEAKNMLKYTDISIKEIVYRLRFPNQSSFYRFFKAHTGMTPSEYRKG